MNIPFSYSFIHLAGSLTLIINTKEVKFDGDLFKHQKGGYIYDDGSKPAFMLAVHPVYGYKVWLLTRKPIDSDDYDVIRIYQVLDSHDNALEHEVVYFELNYVSLLSW